MNGKHAYMDKKRLSPVTGRQTYSQSVSLLLLYPHARCMRCMCVFVPVPVCVCVCARVCIGAAARKRNTTTTGWQFARSRAAAEAAPQKGRRALHKTTRRYVMCVCNLWGPATSRRVSSAPVLCIASLRFQDCVRRAMSLFIQ